MNFLKSHWLFILAALITIIGIITGWYLFILLVIPFGFLSTGKKKENHD